MPDSQVPQETEGQGRDLMAEEDGRLFTAEQSSQLDAVIGLADRYGVPPFSILDRKQGYWMERGRQWKRLGIESEIGRTAMRKDGGTGGANSVWMGNDGVSNAMREGGNLKHKEGSVADYPKTQGMTAREAARVQEEHRERKVRKGSNQHGDWEVPEDEPTQRRTAFNTGSNPVMKRKDGFGDASAALDAFNKQKKAERSQSDGSASVATMQHLWPEEQKREASIFDPVLCELAYRWFCPEGGTVLDPFAGGSVRGIIAGACGRPYIGVDLSEQQIAANREQADRIFEGSKRPKPRWMVGDSLKRLDLFEPESADFVFSCPPYGDLEVYSDDERDLSTMVAEDFDWHYAQIIAKSVERLAPNSFAAFVVGNYRIDGNLRDLCGITVSAFQEAGTSFYNDAIILDPVGSAAVRAAGMFKASRKLCRMHQFMLVFCKGDPKKATEKLRKWDDQKESGDLPAQP